MIDYRHVGHFVVSRSVVLVGVFVEDDVSAGARHGQIVVDHTKRRDLEERGRGGGG